MSNKDFKHIVRDFAASSDFVAEIEKLTKETTVSIMKSLNEKFNDSGTIQTREAVQSVREQLLSYGLNVLKWKSKQ